MNENGRSLLDSVSVKGYLGFMLCYMRSITPSDLFEQRYDALYNILSEKYTEDQDFDYVIDFAIHSRLVVPAQRIAVLQYFGLDTHRPHSVRDTAIILNHCSVGSHEMDPYYDIDEVGVLIGTSLQAIGADVEFDGIIRDISAKFEATETCVPDDSSIPGSVPTCDCCNQALAETNVGAQAECSHCCETCAKLEKKGKKKTSSKKAAKKASSKKKAS